MHYINKIAQFVVKMLKDFLNCLEVIHNLIIFDQLPCFAYINLVVFYKIKYSRLRLIEPPRDQVILTRLSGEIY